MTAMPTTMLPTVARTNAARVLSFGVARGLGQKPRLRFERELDACSASDRIPLATMFDLWATLVQDLNAAELPIAIAEEFQLEQLDLLGLVVMTAPTVKESLESFARFAPLLNDGRRWDVGFTKTNVQLRLFEERRAARRNASEPTFAMGRRFSHETALAQVVRSIRLLCNDASVRPTSIRFAHPAPCSPSDLRAHYAFFDCELIFDESSLTNEIELSRDVLETCPRLGNVVLWRHLRGEAEGALARLEASAAAAAAVGLDLESRVANAIEEAVAAGRVPEIAEVAASMGTTERTLRRQLTQRRGASFRTRVDDARRARAEHLLKVRSPGVAKSVTELAFELGFSDSSSFTHACRRWFGAPPSRFA